MSSRSTEGSCQYVLARPSGRRVQSCLLVRSVDDEAALRSKAGSTHQRGTSAGRDLDGEFDPGSGRTLAARLTHASRARTGASVPGTAANGCVTREQPAPKTGTSRGNLV